MCVDLIKSVHFRVIVIILLTVSCEKISLVEAFEQVPDYSWIEEQNRLEEEGLRSEQRFRHPSMSEEQYQGAINAVKKAYQLTDITFCPLQPIAYNTGTYLASETYKGMIYSSVKEIGTYVGSYISFYTFMTAIHNPRSRIYTDRIDESPYHGTNCRSYYGTVCSALVSYALGVDFGSYDFVASDEMEELDYSNIEEFHLADGLPHAADNRSVHHIEHIDCPVPGNRHALPVDFVDLYECRSGIRGKLRHQAD